MTSPAAQRRHRTETIASNRPHLPPSARADVRAGWWQIAELWCRSPVIGGAPTVAVGERDAVIEPEEIGGLVLRRLVLDEDDQVAHLRGDPWGISSRACSTISRSASISTGTTPLWRATGNTEPSAVQPGCAGASAGATIGSGKRTALQPAGHLE